MLRKPSAQFTACMKRSELKSFVDMGEYDSLPDVRDTNVWAESFIEARALRSCSASPCLLAVVGHAGAGKSTVMQRLAAELDLAYVRSDDVRWQLIDEGFNPKQVKGICFLICEKLLEEGVGVAMDADAILNSETLEEIRAELNIPVAVIHVSADDEVIRRRLSGEEGKRRFSGKVALDFYEGRIEMHKERLPEFDFAYVFDGACDLEDQITNALPIIQSALKR